MSLYTIQRILKKWTDLAALTFQFAIRRKWSDIGLGEFSSGRKVAA
jgi:hypothetical protein